MKKCVICKKKTDELYICPEVEKVKYPICSKECFLKYMELWKDEKHFPKNLRDRNIYKV